MSPFMKFNSVEEKARFMRMQGFEPADNAQIHYEWHWSQLVFANEPTVNHSNPVEIDWLKINEEFS